MSAPFTLTNQDTGETLTPVDVTDTYVYPEGYQKPHSARVQLGAFPQCPHTELELVSSTHVKCKNCSVGWEGQNAHLLYEASKH